MPDVLGSPPSPRAALFWNGTQWQWARVAATGHLRIDVMGSALPAGAATAANQALILAQTQLIEDLRHALQSVATDRLQVRGENQLFSFNGVLAASSSGAISGANGFVDSPAVPAGVIWVVTTISVVDVTTAPTQVYIMNRHNAVEYIIKHEVKAFVASEQCYWQGHTYLDQGDTIRAYFIGGLAGNTCNVFLTGYIMTLEV